MKQKLWAIGLFFIGSIGIFSPANARSMPSDAEIKAVLQQRIEQQKQSLGIVVGIVDETGQRIISYGTLGQTDSRAVDGNTLFEIGSITKVFTALALVRLAEAGVLKLDDPISQFLPTAVKSPTWNGQEISLLNLATHTSGLPRLPDNYDFTNKNNPYVDYKIDQLYAFLSNYRLTRAIGTQYDYSNTGSGLLGHLLSRKVGVEFATLIKTQIAQPLQMQDTTIQLTPEQQTRFAIGHDENGKPVSHWDIPTLAGAGALRSTATDMLKFLAVNLELAPSPLTTALQKTHIVQKATEDPNLQIAIGWHVLNIKGTEIIFHTGRTGGFYSFIGFVKQKRRGVVLLSNSTNDMEDIGGYLLLR